MKANYGFMDGSGEFYITINTDCCIDCDEHPCVTACPVGMFEVMVDDYDDEVVAIKDEYRKKIKFECAPCKPVSNRPPLPCVEVCSADALTHSW